MIATGDVSQGARPAHFDDIMGAGLEKDNYIEPNDSLHMALEVS